jgi:hypothetical protein
LLIACSERSTALPTANVFTEGFMNRIRESRMPESVYTKSLCRINAA